MTLTPKALWHKCAFETRRKRIDEIFVKAGGKPGGTHRNNNTHFRTNRMRHERRDEDVRMEMDSSQSACTSTCTHQQHTDTTRKFDLFYSVV